MKKRLITGLVLFGMVALPLMAGKEIRARFFSIQEHEVDSSANSRRESWGAAYRMAQDYPIFGLGIRNANLYSYQYGADMEGRTIHSQYLQILADNGFPGLGLYLLAIGSAWYALQRARSRCKEKKDAEAIRIKAVSAGLESTLFLFCFGAVFLSLEVFELPFLVLLLGTQLSLVSETDDHPLQDSPQEEEVERHQSAGSHI